MTGVAWRWRTALWFVAGCHYWHGIRFKWVRLESNFSSLSSFPSPRPPATTGETIDGGVSFAFEVAALFHSIPYYRLRNRTFCACYMLSAVPNLLRGRCGGAACLACFGPSHRAFT